jgi:hypothetical protein
MVEISPFITLMLIWKVSGDLEKLSMFFIYLQFVE